MNKILEVENLDKFFKVPGGIVRAVNHVNFSIFEGETLGIVGESGCGKTTCGRTCIGMYEKSGGSVKFREQEVERLKKTDRMAFTKQVQCIFQDPFSSLNPRMTVERILEEGMFVHKIGESQAERREMAEELLQKVGLKKEYEGRYPHEFSGGQRQRIGIARALSVNPEFIFCDEPISALDVSVQAQILNLLMELQEERRMTYMFVSHDISMVHHISDRIAVFYMGRIVELADADEICRHPVHPYTKALLSAVPIADPWKAKDKKRIIMQGDIPSVIKCHEGCIFKDRCRYADGKCECYDGELKEVEPGHLAACCHAE